LEHAQSSVLRARGRVLQGQAWLRHGDTAKSARFFQQASAAEDDRVQALGLVGWATCEALQGQPQDGITKIEKVIAENDSDDTELFARAYNALGRCYEVAGKNNDAVLAYLHTDMLFYREFDAHAESLLHLSKLWSAINKPAEASKARQLLKQRYASTFWAKQDASYPN
jgi:tetratricopeptide (TPR) repeat protein